MLHLGPATIADVCVLERLRIFIGKNSHSLRIFSEICERVCGVPDVGLCTSAKYFHG